MITEFFQLTTVINLGESEYCLIEVWWPPNKYNQILYCEGD